jgi:predicted nucleic acid-binding protein
MKNILVDTDVLINFLRGRQPAKAFLASAAQDSVLFCSVITVAELWAGMRPHETEITTQLIDSLNIVEVSREIAERAGSYKQSIKRQNLELMDCIIAASARTIGAALATCNVRHYPMPDIETTAIPGA